ncbi:MAG: hypothetical protein BECKG1743E_GA0114224_112771 [Candidatus Kentron sp. G]|nr:MAG: hypothetical protein BECKG1743E_GA0114224_111761 [Candidatus Kentron sp. G]VFN07387.1 MAG: hypothetical protein BECKG1743E_GA0114224_111991 [Candidatus Kentron sp. G]VFN07709.1 MAG: hypothetical protein BECKG1743E_GA0114224_112771 [Candidatus Kentron sp. G]
MILSEHSLRQIDEPYIRSLSEKPCQDLAVKLLFDLKAVHERLNQNPTNSSMPPSSRLAWVTNDSFGDESKDEEQGKGIGAEVETEASEQETSTDTEQQAKDKSGKQPLPVKRNPGKQPGAPGYGRTQQLPITDTVHHRVSCCDGCGRETVEGDEQVAWTGFYTIDVKVGGPGIEVTNTKHIYYDLMCPCGHVLRLALFRG